jgi:hypothetical protein
MSYKLFPYALPPSFYLNLDLSSSYSIDKSAKDTIRTELTGQEWDNFFD